VDGAQVVNNSLWFEGHSSKLKLLVTWSSRVAAIFVCLFAAGVLLTRMGVAQGMEGKTSGNAGLEVIAAVALLMGGISLALVHAEKFRWLQRVLAVFILALGVVSVAGSFLPGFVLHAVAPKMNVVTSLVFALLGVALLLLGGKRRGRAGAQILALPAALLPGAVLAGYAYGVPGLAGEDHWTAMPFPTALGCLVLAVAVLHARPAEGLIRIFTAGTSGGLIARWMTPASLLLPILLGSIFVEDRFNFGQLRLGVVFIALSNGVLSMALVWTLAFFLDRNEREKDNAQEDAEMDSLTRVHSRRYFEARIRDELKRNARFQGFFSLILFDIDHFKKLNDSSGHMVGDAVLETLAQITRNVVRQIDVVCRFGGEEFAVIAPLTRGENAIFLANRIRSMIENTKFPELDARITISAGISEYPQQATTRDALVARADAALYAAKQQGRNCVVHSASIEIPTNP
jgi:diguanylate cyclase (GGDEF)-like protein